MTGQSNITLTPLRLKYKKGDLIIKQGDYGISMYKILSGKIQILAESEDLEIPLVTLMQGDVIGEMIFLDKTFERRTASARALEDSELELWHPDMITREYEKMPPILKLIADQTLARLNRMNKLVPQLIGKSRKTDIQSEQNVPSDVQRRFYRKEVALPASGKAVEARVRGRFEGEIKDVSFTGVGVEIRPKSVLRCPYEENEVFKIHTTLPNGKKIDFTAKIISVSKGVAPGTFFLGMSITHINEQSKKDLGFFLMPA